MCTVFAKGECEKIPSDKTERASDPPSTSYEHLLFFSDILALILTVTFHFTSCITNPRNGGVKCH